MIATLHTSKFNIESTFAGFNYPRYIAALPRGSVADRLARRSPVVCGKTYQPAPDPVGGRGTLARGFYLGDGSQPFTRWDWCDDVDDRILHTGWFADPDGDGDKVRGIVVRLSHGRGFLAGWAMGGRHGRDRIPGRIRRRRRGGQGGGQFRGSGGRRRMRPLRPGRRRRRRPGGAGS